ncbi:MAG: hypothetical protein M1829_006584 [Trizodia sp. TS-e1964]|nr:MAG: hypothetical protein M1829_006584 [Trizodia sp. TS-e1964]
MALSFRQFFRPICSNSSSRLRYLKRTYSSTPFEQSTIQSSVPIQEPKDSSSRVTKLSSQPGAVPSPKTALERENRGGPKAQKHDPTWHPPTDTEHTSSPATPLELTPIIQPTEPYFVHRSTSKNLPIYLDYKRGGNRLETRLRKLEGNLGVLREQLIKSLKLPPEDVAINQLTKHIIIKGHKKDQLKKFLIDRHF